MGLTTKQEIFCLEVIKQPTVSDAYRIAYETSNMTAKTVNEASSKLLKNYKIATRVSKLREKMEKKQFYTLEKSIKRDLKLIERYEAALDVLEDINSETKDLETAERTIKFIGVTGYGSAQDRLSKQHGFFEKDNSQKKIPERTIVNMSDYKKE